MNERIKELAEQANNDVSGNAFSMARYNEKFAELIVRECISQIGEFTGEQNVEPVVLADGTRGYDYDTVSAEEVLRKHFGFEQYDS